MVQIIRRIAESKGYSLAELERLCDLPRTTISRWDTRMPAADKLAKVSSILGVSTQQLLGMDEPTQEEKSKEELLEEAFNRPSMRTLFSLAENAPDEDIEYVIKKLEKLRG